jgi:hypothetical protein
MQRALLEHSACIPFKSVNHRSGHVLSKYKQTVCSQSSSLQAQCNFSPIRHPGAALSFQWTPKRTAVIQIQNREYCTGNQSHRTRDMFRHRAPQITHTRDLALYKSKAPSLEHEIVSFALMIQHITFGASLYQV